MRTLLFLSILLTFSSALNAQKSNMVFFSEDEEKFYLVVNGIQQNAEPLSNVKLTNMPAPTYYKIRVKFANDKLGIVTSEVVSEDNKEKTWNIKPKKKKDEIVKYVIREFGTTDISASLQNDIPPSQVIVYHTEPLAGVTPDDDISLSVNVGDESANVSINVSGNVQSSSNATTTTTTVYGSSEGAVPAVMYIGCDNPIGPYEFQGQLSRIKSQTTASGKKIIAQKIAEDYCLTSKQVYQLCNALEWNKDKMELAKYCYLRCNDPENYEEVYKCFSFSQSVRELDDYIKSVKMEGRYEPRPKNPPVVIIYVPGYTGPIGCPIPMSANNFSSIKKTISNTDFEHTKLSTAKTIVGTSCLTTDQVIEVCRLFDFEHSKLDFAKFAYSKTYDRGNYHKVNNVFDFNHSKEELNAFVQNGGK